MGRNKVTISDRIRSFLNPSLVSDIKNEIENKYVRINESIKALDKRTSEISFNIECVSDEIENLGEAVTGIDDSDEELKVVKSLIAVMDIIEDFNVFAETSENSEIKEHAKLLWRTAVKKIGISSLVRIADENTKIDAQLNTIVAVDENSDFEEGEIIKTLRSGYTYKGKVIRRSEVLVSKKTKHKGE